jgi:WD40 repeat protein
MNIVSIRHSGTIVPFTVCFPSSFPGEILQLIYRHLNTVRDVVHFSFANRRLYILVSSDNPLWSEFLHKRFPDSCVHLKLKANNLSLYKDLAIAECNIKAGKYAIKTLNDHQSYVNCVLVRKGRIFSGSSDNTIKIWDLESGQPLQTFFGHQDSVYCILVNKDKLISGSVDKTIKVWDLKGGQTKTLLGHQDVVTGIVINKGKLISSSWDNTIKIWDLESKQPLQTFSGQQSYITSIVICGNKLISRSLNNTIEILNLENGYKLSPLKSNDCTCIGVYNGKLITSYSSDKTIKIWDLEKKQKFQSINGYHVGISCMAVYNGKFISGSLDKTIKVWDLKGGQLLHTLQEHQGAVTSIAVYNGKVISGSRDKTIKIWDFNP